MESKSLNIPNKIDIFGINFSETNLDQTAELLINYSSDSPGFICFPCTASIANAHKNEALKYAINQSIITLADGKFTEYYAALKGFKSIKNVSGYWLMDKLLQSNKSHFFYGSDNSTLGKLNNNLSNNYPSAKILGFKEAPFVNVEDISANKQILKDIEEINMLNPDFIWVSMSHPKQEFLMYHFSKKLNRGIMLGVGAVFLYHADILKKGPEVLKKFALRWVYRLFQQPKKFIDRNHSIPGILKFLNLILLYDILKFRKYS